MKRAVSIVLFAAFSFLTALAQSASWTMDKAHSSVTFTVSHMVISEVTGKFKDFDITLTSSKSDFTDASVEGTIRVNSIDTGVERRDNHLTSDDFFNAEKFPEIKFKSSSVEKIDDRHYKIHGKLTIRDVSKDVTFDAVLNGTITGKQGVRSGWKATMSINRFDYGLKWNRTLDTGGLVAGDTINITLNLEFTKTAS